MSTKFTCRFCKEQFDVPKGLYKHLQSAHNAGISRDNRTCPICGVLCSKYEGYRDHLLYIHGQTDDGQKLQFKSLNEFLVWKAELELKHNCKYILQTSPKVLPSKEKKYFYQCDRSDSKSKDKKSIMMKTCSSVISVVEGTGVFKVEYWDSHSGHSDSSSVQSVQSELEAAISSVEMVNAVGDSGDDSSFDRSEELVMPETSSPSVPNVQKQTFFMKTKPSSSINSFNPLSIGIKKSKTVLSSSKVDTSKKKNTNTSILHSLASVACGKGISKKIVDKSNESKNNDALSTSKTDTEPSSKIVSEKSNDSSISVPEESRDDPTLNESVTEVASVTQESSVASSSSSSSTTTTTTMSTILASLPAKAKTASHGLPAIAPKIAVANNDNINSLFTPSSAFPNQFVIVNPVGMDQNSVNSSQNVFTAGQNILFSIGSLGQNVVPANTAPQPVNPISAEGEKNVSTSNSKPAKAETSLKNNTSNVMTTSSESSLTITQSTSNSITSSVPSTATSTAPITLTTGVNNTPVILSSLPVGSTFMSVNNNLIPIASPSGTFLPTSLPPNIVLTPVVPGTTTVPNTDTLLKTTFSTASSVSSSPPSMHTQVRYTTPSTVAITVSSIVKEPVYTSSAIKHMSNIVTSSASSITPTSSLKLPKNKTQNKFVPIAVSGRISPIKSSNKFMTSTPIKTYSNKNKNSFNALANNVDINSAATKAISALCSKLGHNSTLTNKVNSDVLSISTLASDMSTVTISSVPSLKTSSSARKRITKSTNRSLLKSALQGVPIATSVNTNVVNSRLNLAPISSAPNVTMTPQQMAVHKPGTLLFKSSGDVYMLEPVENDVETIHPLKSVSSPKTSLIKIDRAMQTTESSNITSMKSKLQRKRAAPPTDDSAVMLKVKCYQLEMKYLNIQTECKRLKVELTKEKLKNAELTGEKAPTNVEEEVYPDSRSKAAEIMKEIEDKFSENKDVNVYTMTKTSVLRSLYEDLEELCIENSDLHKELENYRAHDKFYKSLKKKLYEEEF